MKVYITNKVKNRAFILKELTNYFDALFQIATEEVEKDADIKIVLVENECANDEIIIEIFQGKGIIQSNSEAGLLIAVYRLFHEYGVRYVKPGRRHEYIPKLEMEKLNKKVSVKEHASYKHRGVCIEGADSFKNIVDFIDWIPKIGMNSFFIQFENPYSFLKRWYEHEFNPYLNKEEFSTEIAQSMSDKIDQELAMRSLTHHRVGHGWTGEVLGYSSKYGWESGVKLAADKEPLVAELDGKRDLFATAPILTSLDFSNPEVISKMVELIVTYARNRKDVDYLHVWLSDAHNNVCECSSCQNELLSDQYIKMLNKLDQALEEAGLQTRICFLLYHELLIAPKNEKIKNPDRFTMMFAPISRTFEKSYADVDYDNLETPEKYVRNQLKLPNSLEQNLSYLTEWQNNFKGDSFVYDYPLGRAHYGDLGYMKISEVIFNDIKYLEKLHLDGYISCQELRAGFPHNFPNYVMGRTLWNKNISFEQLKKEYFEAIYGDQWDKAVVYLENLSEHSSCDYFNAIGDRIDEIKSLKFGVAVNLAKESLKLIEENISNMEGIQKAQWIQLGYHREYVIKLGTALHYLSGGRYFEAQRQWHDFVDYIRRNEQQVQTNLDVYRVIEVAKNYAGFEL